MKKNGDLQCIDLNTIMEKIKSMVNDDFDMVVAIARGGILPGYLVSRYLDIPFEIIKLNFRDDSHNIIRDEPTLLEDINFDYHGKRVLLADDVSNSGSTIKKAAALIQGALITTLVISGNADISLFGKHDRCILWPWMALQ